MDASGAIVTRLILLHFKVSFLGREEVDLTAKLGNELPGIVNRALAAYRRMKARGLFRQPESGRSMIDQLTRSVDPVAAWLDDCAIIDATGKVRVEDAIWSFEDWLKEHEHRDVSETVFGTRLRSQIPDFDKRRLTPPEEAQNELGTTAASTY